MLKPHLLLTVVVFAILGALIAHFIVERNGPWSNQSRATANNPPATNTSAGSGASTGTSSGTNADADRGDRTTITTDNRRRADNDNDSSDESSDDNSSGSSYGDDDNRNVPGQFDYYALTLSWSPTYCADQGQDDDTQCNRRDGRRYSFVLHGLWPQYEHGWPSNCPLPRRPFVAQPVIDSMMDIMPSQKLVIHEYRTHGTCSGLDPVHYFATAHRIFDSIQIPERFHNPMEPQLVAPFDIRAEFLQANPRFRSDMIAVVCGGHRLKEVRLCLGKDGQPRRCGSNENQQKLCSTDQVFIPPARSTVPDAAPQPAPAPDIGLGRDSPGNDAAKPNGSSTGPGPYAAPHIAPGDYLPGPRTDYSHQSP